MKRLHLEHSFCISPIGFTSSVFSHLEELRVNGLVGLTQNRDEVAGLSHVVWCEEGIGGARLLTASCSANTMDIILRVVGVVKVDDKFHVFNICKIVLRCSTGEEGSTQKMCTTSTTTTRSKTKRPS